MTLFGKNGSLELGKAIKQNYTIEELSVANYLDFTETRTGPPHFPPEKSEERRAHILELGEGLRTNFSLKRLNLSKFKK